MKNTWRVNPDADTQVEYLEKYREGSQFDLLCEVSYTDDAHLISAAPDLFSALDKLLHALPTDADHSPELIDAALDAVAALDKAKGGAK